MEIRDPLHGSIELTPPETAIIDSVFFQRLRNIKQLGFTEFAFPGATHNRYCHSLGALHLTGQAFDHIFHGFSFSTKNVGARLRQAARLAALLHDVGHGPLSHTTEEVMPPLSELGLKIYDKKPSRRANHEDYTIKILTDSSLTPLLKREFPDLLPEHIACLVDKSIKSSDDFFEDKGIGFRPLLSQLISSELDVDRMDYLARDSYYCGTSYGHVDSDWLLPNMTYYRHQDNLYLALNRRALYTFDDFLISRYHMYLMVYFHHKGIIYDEMLLRYLKSKDCDFFLPSDIEEYVKYDDYKIHTHLAQSRNPYAQMISQRKPFRMLFESHDQKSKEVEDLEKLLEKNGIDVVRASSKGRLSKYYSGDTNHAYSIYVIDQDYSLKPVVRKIEETTEIFKKYEGARKIERLYVSLEDHTRAQKLLQFK